MRTRWNTVHELPYRFATRGGGASKATFNQGVMFVKHCLRLVAEARDVGRSWRFLVLNSGGMIVNLAALGILARPLHAPRLAVWLMATEAATAYNFCFMRWFGQSGRDASDGSNQLAQLARYHEANATGIIANGVGFGLASLAGASTIAAGVVGIVGGAIAGALQSQGPTEATPADVGSRLGGQNAGE
jgi:hypothetical protein